MYSAKDCNVVRELVPHDELCDRAALTAPWWFTLSFAVYTHLNTKDFSLLFKAFILTPMCDSPAHC